MSQRRARRKFTVRCRCGKEREATHEKFRAMGWVRRIHGWTCDYCVGAALDLWDARR